MRRPSISKLLVLSLLSAACGGDKTTTDPGNGTGGGVNTVTNGSFSATINGAAWSPTGRVAVSKSGTVVAIAAVSLNSYVVSLAIGNVATGTFSLNYLNQTASLAIVSNASGQGWTTFTQGGTGTLTITTYTASRIAGTFSFDAAPTSGGATGTLHVTNGSFDITY